MSAEEGYESCALTLPTGRQAPELPRLLVNISDLLMRIYSYCEISTAFNYITLKSEQTTGLSNPFLISGSKNRGFIGILLEFSEER